MKNVWPRIALFNFLIIATLGALMRYAFVNEVPWLDYRNVMQSHSYFALTAWISLLLFVLLMHTFGDGKLSKAYHVLLLFFQITLLGILLAFVTGGGGKAAFLFMLVNIVLIYILTGFFLKTTWSKIKALAPKWFIGAAFFFLVLSTLGILMMITAIFVPDVSTFLFYTGAQVFFHFQMNGWFVFALLAIVYKEFQTAGNEIRVNTVRTMFWLLFASCMLTTSLIIAWIYNKDWAFVINSIGAVLQLVALVFFLRILKKQELSVTFKGKIWPGALLRIALWCWIIKVLIQTTTLVPAMAAVAFTIRNFVIGYFHLQLIGAISLSLLALAIHKKYFHIHSILARTGIVLLLIGFVISEIILFSQGVMFWANKGFLPYYYETLFGVSALLPLGILLFLVAQFRKNVGSERQ